MHVPLLSPCENDDEPTGYSITMNEIIALWAKTFSREKILPMQKYFRMVETFMPYNYIHSSTTHLSVPLCLFSGSSNTTLTKSFSGNDTAAVNKGNTIWI